MRAVLAMILGVLAGGALAFFALDGTRFTGSHVVEPARSSFLSEAPPDHANARVAAGLTGRLRVYESLAASDDPTVIEASIARAAAEPQSLARDFELEAFALRLLEIDPRRAIAAAIEAGVEHGLVARLFRVWAERDVAAALGVLGTLDDSALARDIALSLLEGRDDDAAWISRLADVLPALDILDLRIAALASHAARDPLGALRRALASPDVTARQLALPEIGAVWASRDPYGALAMAGMIPELDLREDFKRSVLVEWAALDAESLLAYLQTEDSGGGLSASVTTAAALRRIALVDPEQLLAAAARFPEAQSRSVARLAIQALAERDPEAALARAALLPPGQEDALMFTIATAYARRDPAGALVWADGLDPPSSLAFNAVAKTVAGIDVEHAVEIVLEARAAGADVSLTGPHFDSDPETMRRVADRLVALGTPDTRALLAQHVSRWTLSDPYSALEWALTSGSGDVQSEIVRRAAVTLGPRDPVAAARFAERMPAELREDWERQIALMQTATDGREPPRVGAPAAAADRTRVAIVEATARDPREAAMLLEQASAATQAQMARGIAAAWVERSPEEAARWAQELGDADARNAAIWGVASSWWRRDSAAAERWVATLQRGTVQDGATASFVAAAAATGSIDEGLLARFSSDTARQRALAQALPALADRSPDEARALLERHVTDPELRRIVEIQLAAPGR